MLYLQGPDAIPFIPACTFYESDELYARMHCMNDMNHMVPFGGAICHHQKKLKEMVCS